ncbi:tail fiber domain-containing protein [Candidatus Roizmanbacteria bacterium]|nr:MAG: tail fiber domain-containing protein [Candidatus Roizmanbacteria bacterium]
MGSTAPPVRFQDSDGYCEINPTTTTWTCTSDATLKEDVETLSSIYNLEKLNQLRPVSFKWKTQNDDDKRFGLIAQEVETLFPEFVQTDENGLKSVSYGSFTPILISAVQEQQLQIEGQQSSLTKLTEELALVVNEDTGVVTSSLIDTLTEETENIADRTAAVEGEVEALAEKDSQIETRLITIEERLNALEQASASASLDNLNDRVGFLEQLFTGIQASGSADLSTYLAELIDGQILGLQSDEATLSALTVSGDTNVNNLAVTGEISSGLLIINGFDDSLATPAATISTLGGSLKIQHLGLGEIEFMAGKSKIDTDGDFIMLEGDLVIETGVIKGNDQFRGIDVPAVFSSTYLDIDFESMKDTDEYAVNITPTWLTNVAVIEKRTDGFRLQFSVPAPLNGKIDWMIIE